MSQEVFNTRMGAIAAAAGSAVGLGNIWRFPYILGEHGGAAFLILYILCSMLIALPVLISEFAIGRNTGRQVTEAFRTLSPNGKWYYIGLSGVLCAFIILSFYNIIAGWTLYYTYMSIVGSLNGLNENGVQEVFSTVSSDPVACIIWAIIVAVIVAVIVARGVQEGIERYSKVLMPLLFVLIIVMCIRAITLDGAVDGLKFLLQPDFSKLTPEALFAALGQSFFSLSIGMGVMTTYGSYIGKNQSITNTAFSVAVIDFFVAFLAAMVIFPCAFAFGINPGSGPGLVFVTLPNIFNQMMFGQFMAVLFFLLLAIAAITSSISLLEVLVSYAKDKYNLKRKAATAIATALTVVLSVVCSVWSEVLNLFDNFSANVMMPLGAFFIVIFIPLVMGKMRVKSELEAHGGTCKVFNTYYFLVKYIVPIAILLIFANGILSWCGIDILA